LNVVMLQVVGLYIGQIHECVTNIVV
jgi:hypothetical protein